MSVASSVERGRIVGESFLASGNRHGFVWENGSMRDLGTLPAGDYSRAADINDRGQVVGYSTTADGSFHAFFWEEGTLVDIGTLPIGRFSDAFEINSTTDGAARLPSHGEGQDCHCVRARIVLSFFVAPGRAVTYLSADRTI